MGELELTRVEEINAEHHACEAAVRSAVDHAIRAGEMLAEVKGRLRHGEWLPWLLENFEGSERQAQTYMRVARNKDELNPQRASDMSIRSALAQLSASEPADYRLAALSLPKRRGFQREDAIRKAIFASLDAEPAVYEARRRLVAYLEAVCASNPNPDLETMRGRICGRLGRPSPEEMGLLKTVYPGLHREVKERLADFDRKLRELEALEELVIPADIPPCRERFELERRFGTPIKGQDWMRKPLGTLRAEGNYRPFPCSMEERFDDEIKGEI